MTADIPPVCSGIGASLEADGYAIARRIFDATEIADTLAFYMGTAERGAAIPGHWEPDLTPGALAERRFARFDMAHEIADGIRRMVFHDRLKVILRAIMGDEPVMIWNVFYYMPPGARGFPYHQDDYWNRVGPGAGITAWIALDDVDAENGGVARGARHPEFPYPATASGADGILPHRPGIAGAARLRGSDRAGGARRRAVLQWPPYPRLGAQRQPGSLAPGLGGVVHAPLVP